LRLSGSSGLFSLSGLSGLGEEERERFKAGKARKFIVHFEGIIASGFAFSYDLKKPGVTSLQSGKIG